MQVLQILFQSVPAHFQISLLFRHLADVLSYYPLLFYLKPIFPHIVGCPFIDRPFDDDWGLMDPTGKSDEDFIEVIKEIEDKIIQLKNSL